MPKTPDNRTTVDPLDVRPCEWLTYLAEHAELEPEHMQGCTRTAVARVRRGSTVLGVFCSQHVQALLAETWGDVDGA